MLSKIQLFNIFMLAISLLGIIGFVIFNPGKLKLLKCHLFSNAVKVMLFISDKQYYVLLNYVEHLEVSIHLKQQKN